MLKVERSSGTVSVRHKSEKHHYKKEDFRDPLKVLADMILIYT